MHSSAEFKKTNPNPFVAELRFQCLNYPVLKYQKSFVLQPERKAVPLADQGDLAGIILKPN